MEEAPLLIERRGPILILTLNRPHVRNAMNAASSQALTAALDDYEADPSLFVGIITGAGGHFSAGADLKASAAQGHSGSRTARGPMGICERPPAKPMIAAVEGAAAGGGFEIALACHLIVAAETARMGLPEVRHNLVANGGGLLYLPSRIPTNIAAEVVLTGDLFPAEFFHRHGLINRLTPPGEALAGALELAERLIRNGPTALAAAAAILRAAPGWPADEAWARQAELARPALESEDRREGARAFVEKRPPVWQGK
ncbi:crotonase/enoyl-CoA hydratase family protein [Sphingomonas sp. AOB5]|uniref:crotonase/enoyl-CoA hydratase family protein n=1 Tax=Sphingomonas sp. AOB5 TaxID=3034017 RepID=UPI0023F99A24|nr:crotonase/enoyl-CoA hydratase family protein [Sphingomonas sp. AOB5]MDF7774757.1 crotonase/enoyl-CoA hydratase family protein [Sphingomonas sp. AOB5]